MEIAKILKKAYVKFYEKFAQKEINPHPLIYFLLFMYFHVFKNEHSLSNIYLLSIFPFAIFATLNFNFMFMTAIFLRLPNMFAASIIFLLTLTIGCNQKWKTFIFLFNVGVILARSTNIKPIYFFLAAGILCHEIYNGLTCRTLSDNQNYFLGFFVISVYGAINFMSTMLNVDVSIYVKILMLIISGLYARHLFTRKIQKINNTNVNHIKDCRIISFYLSEFQQKVRTEYVMESKTSIHKRQCNNIHCFCNRQGSLKKQNYFLRQLYENSVKKFPQSCDTLLYEHYIDFLLKNELVLNALHFLQKWNPKSHYSFIGKVKSIYKIKKMFADLDSSNLYDKQYRYALQYDQLFLNLTMEIYEVLELKLNFWHQVAKETPIMIKLQDQGLKIVNRMYQLNVFYNQTIKKYEQKLYSFDATILYAMYLLSTTNFKQYAQLIIKNTSKVLQQVQILQNNSSETYAIKTVIKQQGFFYMRDLQTELHCLQLGNKNAVINKSAKFKLIIDNVCTNFCKLVKMNKEKLVGQQLSQLIPDGYRHVHNSQLLKILNFQCEELGEIVSSKILHKNQKLPMKVGTNELIMSYISIKTMVDIKEGSSFVTIIKKTNDKTINALINFEGTLTEKQLGFNEQVLMHSQFKKYVSIITERWKEGKIIKEQRFNVVINAMNFCIIINSPLSAYFLNNFELLENFCPPLHVQIVNESSTKNKGMHGNTHDKLVKEIKHMQNAINHDSQSSSSSKNSTSAVNILSTFSQKDTVPIYRRIIVGFIFVITCCLIVSMIGFLVFNLDWDNTDTSTFNPLNSTLDFMKLEHITANTLLNLWDVQQYLANKNLNQTEISKYFSSRSSYVRQIDSIFKKQFTQFKKYFFNCLKNPSSLLSDEFDDRFITKLNIYNMSVIPSNISFQQQTISFESLLMNYLDDFNLMSRGFYDDSLLLPSSYTVDVINLQNGTKLGQIIDTSIDNSLEKTLILTICMSILIALLIIPMFFFLRSRLPMHQKIFDLFASIQSEMVINEIKSLTYINNIIKNYGQSSQILKTNVIQYQENAIYPKRDSSRKSSVTNQIVIGLERFDMMQEMPLNQSKFDKFKDKDTKNSSKLKNNIKRKSHITNYGGIRQYMDMKKILQKRKRAGDLDFTGSQSDPKMRFNKKHFIIYIMALIFIIFLSLEATTTQIYGTEIKTRKSSMMSVLDTYTNSQLSFLLGKLYLRNGNAGLMDVDPAYRLQYLQSVVQSIPIYDYKNNYGYDKIYQNCSTTRNGTTSYSKVVCMYNYSFLTLLGQFGSVFKDLFEARYTADQDFDKYVASNQTDIYKQIVTNISSKVFYLQTVVNQLENLVYNIVDYVYLDMYNYSLYIKSFKLTIFIASVCWWVVTAVVGIFIILNMKKQYFKQVYMLTFLNRQMIMNNKRVESFLDSINKSSSN